MPGAVYSWRVSESQVKLLNSSGLISISVIVSNRVNKLIEYKSGLCEIKLDIVYGRSTTSSSQKEMVVLFLQ